MTGPIPDDTLAVLREQAARGRYITPNQVVRMIDEILTHRDRQAARIRSPRPRTPDGKNITVTAYPSSTTEQEERTPHEP